MVGDYAYVGGASSTARKIHIPSGKTVKIYKGHAGPVSCIAVAGAMLVTGSWDRSIIVWDIESKEEIRYVRTVRT